MTDESQNDKYMPRAEFERRFNALDRRIARNEKMVTQMLSQIRGMDARSGSTDDRLKSFKPPGEVEHILSIIEELEGESGVSVERVKDTASEERLLRSTTRMTIQMLVDDGFLEEVDEEGNLVRINEWPDGAYLAEKEGVDAQEDDDDEVKEESSRQGLTKEERIGPQ